MVDLLYHCIRWIAGHVRGVYAAVGVFMLVGITLAAVAAAGFAVLASHVAGGAARAADQAVVSWAREHPAPWLDGVAVAGAVLGSGVAAWVVLAGGTLLFLLDRRFFSALVLWVALLGGRVLSRELKGLFDRPRPDPIGWELEVLGREVAFPTSPSFPSGHAVTSVVVFGTLAFLLVRLQASVWLRRATLATSAALILLIGLSRIYLGVHYPSDVLAGYLAGFVWATFSVFSLEVIRYAAGRRPELAAGEQGLERGMRPLREALGEETPA